MGPTTRLALGGAAALLVGALLWSLRGNGPAPVQSPAAEEDAPTAAAVATTSVASPSDAQERTALPGARPDDTALSHPFAFELEVRVQDRLGLPVAGAKVLLAPAGCRLDEVPERTDDSGTVRIRWNGRRPTMSMVVATTSDETREAMRHVTVASGETARTVFGGSARRRATLHLVRSGGDGQTFSVAIEGLQSAGGQGITLAFDGIVLQQGAFGDNPRMREGLHPFASFGDLQWQKRDESQEQNRFVTNFGVVNFSFTAADIRVAGPPDDAPKLPARIEGIVYGEDGRPCPKCPVSWGRQVDRPRESTETDADGAFQFDDVPDGALELRAGGADDGLQHLTVSAMRGQTTQAELQLRREAAVRGRAVGADGAPLAGWRVEWVGLHVPWFDSCTVADDGSFVLPNLPGGAGVLLLWRGEGPARLPVARIGNVLPDTGEVELRFEPEVANGTLLVEPMLPDGVDRAAVEVRVFQEDTGRGTTLQKAKDSNQFVLRGLAAGWYRLELGGPGLGWLDAGRHYVDGKGVFDVGRAALAATGTLRLQLPEGAEIKRPDEDGGFALEIYRRRADCDVRIEDVAAASGESLPLPPGDYLAMWRSATGAPEVAPFTVQSGREVTVRCTAADVPSTPADDAAGRR